jgi:hypothetical protein
MIKADAQLSIRRLPLSCLVVTECASCFPSKFMTYLGLLQDNPDQDVDPLIVAPLPKYPGLFVVCNGKHRFVASIMAGRRDVICVVVEEKP